MPAQRSMIYDSTEEANNRLAGTVVMYDKEPVFVREAQNHADGCIRVMIIPFPFNGSASRKRIDSPLFRGFRPPSLGFINYFDGGRRHTIWAARTSPRTRRQGLCNENFRARPLVDRDEGSYRFETLYRTDAFREMAVGEYPDFNRSLEMLVPDSSIGVDRDFALLKERSGVVSLYYKREPIGVVFKRELYLNPDQQYLREMILENPRLPDHLEIL